MKYLMSLFIVISSAGLLSACSVSGSITEVGTTAASVISQTGGGELVSGSNQNAKTTSGLYKVQSSTGQKLAPLKLTTASGYKVYQSVQGALVSTQ